jgi:hypothetical protein
MNGKIRSLCLGVLLVSALGALQSSRAAQADSAAKSEPIQFKRAAWRSGDTITSKLDTNGTLTVAMAVKGEVVQHFDQVNHEMTRKKNTVLAAGADGPTKVSVHYDDVVEIQQGSDDPDAKTTSPIAGKTFVLEKNSKGVTITDEDGTVVGEDIAGLVREKELSRDASLERGFDRIADLVSEHTRKIGEKIEVPDELALEIAGGDEDLKDGRMNLSLRELRDVDGASCGVFAAELKLSGTAGADEYRTAISLQGEILIRIDGARFVSAELSGRVTVDGAVTTEDTTVTISGEGPLKIVESAAYGHEEK